MTIKLLTATIGIAAYFIAAGIVWLGGVDPFRSMTGMLESQLLAIAMIFSGILIGIRCVRIQPTVRP